MNEQFIPYEQALELKELGFNEICLTYYNFDGKIELSDDWAFGADMENKRDKNQCLAPLWQQAFDWFREKHNVYCAITSSTMMIDWTYYIFKALNSKPLDNPILEGWSYEEARLECLKKLIELRKNVK